MIELQYALFHSWPYPNNNLPEMFVEEREIAHRPLFYLRKTKVTLHLPTGQYLSAWLVCSKPMTIDPDQWAGHPSIK